MARRLAERIRCMVAAWWMCAPFAVAGGEPVAAIWQPVMDYSISISGDRTDGTPVINPFNNFTHLGSDFGWMGAGQERLVLQAGAIHARFGNEWTGAWHSLAGLAADPSRTLNPADFTGLGGPAAVLAKATAVVVEAGGSGSLRLELADTGKKVLWSQTVELGPGPPIRHRVALADEDLVRAKFINWVVEPGSTAEVRSIGFEVRRPEISDEEWLLRVSLGKLRRCHDPASGLTRDRAHLPAGVFDSISSTGLHALASATAAAEGWLDRDLVENEVRRTANALIGIERAAGFLPHFVRRDDSGMIVIHPGTEYSTVDTAIALISLRLAGTILGLEDVQDAAASLIAGLKFDLLTSSDGWIGHGFMTDGTTPLASQWRDWGGETALVLMLEAMVPGHTPRGQIEEGGGVFRGVQFISEIQSLFFPDFDLEQPDLRSNTVWPEVRRGLLARQAAYVRTQWPGSPAAETGIFGLSAGESGMPGTGYIASGSDLPEVRWLHPHAMIMGLALSGRNDYAEGIHKLDRAGILFASGLPENVEIGLVKHNPMQGSLNAGFEALSAYHGLRRGKGDLIDEACRNDPLLRMAAQRFYAD